jgi:hypothetical protein
MSITIEDFFGERQTARFTVHRERRDREDDEFEFGHFTGLATNCW